MSSRPVRRGPANIDAKSILGLLSLDLSKPLILQIHSDE